MLSANGQTQFLTKILAVDGQHVQSGCSPSSTAVLGPSSGLQCISLTGT